MEEFENNNEEYEQTEVEEIEFSLDDSEIGEWISELTRLKEEKGTIVLSVDDETDLVLNYSDSHENEEDGKMEGEE